MAQEKISFEQFINVVDIDNKPFVQDLHNYLLDNGCKATFVEKKSGYASPAKGNVPARYRSLKSKSSRIGCRHPDMSMTTGLILKSI